MIIEYFRPSTINEVLQLINRAELKTYLMGGGTVLNQPSSESYAVVDLQATGLDFIKKSGTVLTVGATVPLHRLEGEAGLPEALRAAIRGELNYNLRQLATIAGTIVSADGLSVTVGCLLAMDVSLELQSLDSGYQKIKLSELITNREKVLKKRLIKAVNIPLNASLAFEKVARTEMDKPIIFATVAQWPSGRTRLVLGGTGMYPILALDGPEAEGLEIAARNAYSLADDEWASAEYRQAMAGLLATRWLSQSKKEQVKE